MTFPSTVSQAGVDLIKRAEGLRLVAYKDQGGVWTIGYGHTGDDVHAGMRITEAEAEALLEGDIDVRSNQLKRCLAREPTQGQFDAMASLAYNIGVAAFRNSTVCKRFNDGDDVAAANAFGMWKNVRVNGKLTESAGLVKRRALEKALYLEGTPVEPEHTTVGVEETPAGAKSATVQAASVGGIAGTASVLMATVNWAQDTLMQNEWIGGIARLIVAQYPKFALGFGIAIVVAAGYVIWHRHDQRRKGLL